MTWGLARRFAAFCSVSPVVKCNWSRAHTATSGVTCGRPSARTVLSQNNSAEASSSCVAGHVVAIAVGLLYRSSSDVVGVLNWTAFQL